MAGKGLDWIVVDTGYLRLLGRVESREVGPFGDEIVLTNVARVGDLSFPLPGSDGRVSAAVLPILAPLFPWVPIFSPDFRVRIRETQIIWYADVSEDDVSTIRSNLLSKHITSSTGRV